MIIAPTAISGCFQILPKIQKDDRGSFIKVFNESFFRENNLETSFSEGFYSHSRQRVLRGLHFQAPPKDQAKLVYCVHGKVLDVAIDIRHGSPTFGKHITLELSEKTGNVLYLPKGLAHGFYTLSKKAIMVYHVTSTYSQQHDTGILWNSANIDWPDLNPITSPRDNQFPALSEFTSPFIF